MNPRPTPRLRSWASLGAACLLAAACSGDRPTAPERATPPVLSTSASMMYFEANAPGEYGGVGVDIMPFAGGGPFGGFQSNPGTGQSYDITITFSIPVSSVTITALDPTWAGNLMITSGPGGVIDSYGFAYTNQPGYNVPDAHTVTGEITSVHLVAVTGEYIAYTMQIGVAAQPAFTVSCSSPVDRAQQATCTAAATKPSAKLEVVGWRFTSTDPQLSFEHERAADEDPTAATWSGMMVVSGTVTVKAKVDGGAEEEQSAAIVVTPRSWAGKPIPDFPVNYAGQGPLPPEPHRPQELGRIVFSGNYTVARAFAAGAIGNVPLSGPNAGLVYVKAVPPFVDHAEVYANEVALTKQSSFWYGQREHNPNLVFDSNVSCGRSVVTDPATLEKIKAHEGTAFQDKSHSFYFKQAADAKVGPAVEGLVATDDFTARWDAALDAVWKEAEDASKKTDEVAKLNVGCNFNYDYPSRKNK